jgi:hypothetical protein
MVVLLRGGFEIGYQACGPSSKALAYFMSSVSKSFTVAKPSARTCADPVCTSN